EAEQRLALGPDDFLDDRLDLRVEFAILRHEEMADAILAGFGKLDAEGRAFAPQEAVGKLQQDAGAVADQRVGADSAAMREVFEDFERVVDDLTGFARLEMCDHADAAGVVLVAGIVKTLTGGKARKARARGRGSRSFRHLHLLATHVAGFREERLVTGPPHFPTATRRRGRLRSAGTSRRRADGPAPRFQYRGSSHSTRRRI